MWKTFSISLLLIISLLFLYGCSVEAESSSPLNDKAAQEYLDAVYVAGNTYAPNANCGFVLPQDIPLDRLDIHVYAIPKGSDTSLDLLEDITVETDQWIVLDDLQNYSEVTLQMSLETSSGRQVFRQIDMLAEGQ